MRKYLGDPFFNIRNLVFLVLVTSALITTNTMANGHDVPVFKAQYNANVKGFAVKASRTLTKVNENQFKLNFKATSFIASIDETSTFIINNSNIQASHYQYNQSTAGKKRQRSLVFDTQAQTIQSDTGDNKTSIAYTQSVLDKLNYQLQLQLDLMHGKQSLQYTIADKDNLKDYQFEILNEELLTTPAGSFNSVKVKVIRENKDKITYIWFAKDWQYLLVQLEQYKGEKKDLSIQLKSATVNDQTVTGI